MKTSRIVAAGAGLVTVTLLAAGCSFGGTETVTVTAPTTPTTETTPTTTTATTATTTTTAATTTAKPAESPVVKANKEVQEDLADLGFYDGPVNGVYGPRTTAAVKRFQARAGLPVDGIAGTQTMGAINLALGNDSTDAEDLLQTTLKGLCYYGGNVDGIFGSGTEAALIAFQKAEGLSADGRYGPKTAVALAKAWPGRPSSCSGTNPSGGGKPTGDTLTIGSPKFTRTFDLSSCTVMGRGIQATGSAVGGYEVGLDSPGGPGGTLAIDSADVVLDGTVKNITISVNGQFRATGTFDSGGTWTAVGTCAN
ncbi:MAG: peptidoglycan-binding domain-containing protein [Miltoncostaeaceae bacterium]